MSTKNTLINWFIDIARNMMIYPTTARRVTEADTRKMAEFHSRIIEIDESAGERYSPYDWTRRDGEGKWVFSPSGFLLWIFGNYSAISKVPELRPVIQAYDHMQESIAIRNKMHPSKYKSEDNYHNDLLNEATRGWYQAKLALEVGSGTRTSPSSNTGGKK